MNIRRAAASIPVLLLCVACCTTTVQGREITKTMDFKGFSKLHISGPFDVEITRSDTFDVSLLIDEKSYSKVKTSQSGETLEITFDSHEGCSHCKMNIKISMPELTELNLSGAVDASITGFKSASNLYVDLSGACSLRGEIEASGVAMNLSGASDAELTGSANNLNMELSGASDANLDQFSVAVATVELSGASDAELSVTNELSADLSGASDLTYTGNPTIKSMSTSGGSDISHK